MSTSTAEVDRFVSELQASKDTWAALSIEDRLGLLRRLRPRIAAVAERWVDEAVRAKGIPSGSPWAGEEWLSGPYALLTGVIALERTLGALSRGEPPIPAKAVRSRPDGQLVVDVFPVSFYDRLLMNGVRAEVWMEPGVTRENLAENMAEIYRRPTTGKVALVLGAGNVASIAPLDVLHKLFGEGQVCLLKMNPVNEYLGPIFDEVFSDFIAAGYLRHLYGGTEIGAYAASHPGVETIHMTGSERTFDAIRFGTGDEGRARKRRGEPLNTRPITAELGGVGPCIVLPGPWTDADLRFQAEHVATQKLHNGGFNCVAAQVLVLPAEWPLRTAFLDAIRDVLRTLPSRHAYYPGADRRQAEAVRRLGRAETFGDAGDGMVPRTLITGLDPADAGNYGFNEEFFGSVLAVTELPGRTAGDFLGEAVRFANGTLRGTLGANLIVHPATARELGAGLEDGIAALRYGAVGVNGWVAAAFLLAEGTWGAFPGHTDDDIQSGRGVVHNAYLFSRPERTVVHAPFEPFPRNLVRGRPGLLPKPPWFVTHRRADVVGRRLTAFAASPSLLKLPGIFIPALLG
jgi:aldehyde dehydrogenase (NAD(P)+)